MQAVIVGTGKEDVMKLPGSGRGLYEVGHPELVAVVGGVASGGGDDGPMIPFIPFGPPWPWDPPPTYPLPGPSR